MTKFKTLNGVQIVNLDYLLNAFPSNESEHSIILYFVHSDEEFIFEFESELEMNEAIEVIVDYKKV